MSTQIRFRYRHYTDEDLQAVTDLLNACDAVDKMDDNYSVEDLRTEFEDPALNKSTDMRLWEESEGRLVALGQTKLRESPEDQVLDGDLYMRILPEYREQGLEEEIMSWAEGRTKEKAAELGLPGRLESYPRDHDSYGRGVFERNGLEPVRYFFEMKRDLSEAIPEPQFPEGFKMIHSRGTADSAAWVDMFNQSFIDHWGHHPATVERHDTWLGHKYYNPERDLIAIAPDGTFAAFCFCWVDPENNERNDRLDGWIDILGTRRGYRKIGLGRAMLLSGLLRLREEGMTVAKLGVDAENPTGALRLYESVGFEVAHSGVAYRKSV